MFAIVWQEEVDCLVVRIRLPGPDVLVQLCSLRVSNSTKSMQPCSEKISENKPVVATDTMTSPTKAIASKLHCGAVGIQ